MAHSSLVLQCLRPDANGCVADYHLSAEIVNDAARRGLGIQQPRFADTKRVALVK